MHQNRHGFTLLAHRPETHARTRTDTFTKMEGTRMGQWDASTGRQAEMGGWAGMRGLVFLFLEAVDEVDAGGRLLAVSVIGVHHARLAVHALAHKELEVIEHAEEFLDECLCAGHELLDSVGVVLLEVLLDALHVRLDVHPEILLGEPSLAQFESIDDIDDHLCGLAAVCRRPLPRVLIHVGRHAEILTALAHSLGLHLKGNVCEGFVAERCLVLVRVGHQLVTSKDVLEDLHGC
mmetsp:Transcript_44435/g.125649  ORF Transcript_44435/g.125649 Transcript_44435/m.125649 type:complete len:235 (+) Transcript_44435:1713-2417(+)